MAKKARKKAISLAEPKTEKASHLDGVKPIMVLISADLHKEFSAFRANRRLSRSFPWAVRDCMEVAIRDYLDTHSGSHSD